MYGQHDDFLNQYGYGKTPESSETDYANPAYYKQDAPVWSPLSESVDNPYVEYTEYTGSVKHEDLASYGDSVLPSAYSGPVEISQYTWPEDMHEQPVVTDGKVEPKKKRKGLAGLGGIGATIMALLLKLQGLAFLLKFGIAGITALASVAIYAFFLGWPFAIGLVALLFLHEMGHAIVMKLKGIPVGGMIFVPMLGAAVMMRQMPQNARDEAEVGIAGPIAGTIAASLCLLLARLYPQYGALLASLAYFGFFMNLFNLIPIVPFDGGRVLAAIDRRIWIIGFLGLLAFQIWSWFQGNFSIWLLFFIAMAATQLWARGTKPNTPQEQAYYNVPIGTRIVLSLVYFGLAAVLVLGMSISRGLMPGLN